jgi:CMP-2-keto-3-deoxyoctulosonic acid synthetase
MNNLVFDVMVDGRFYKTMRMPITIDIVVDYQGDKPIINGEKIKEWVLQKCPTLKYDNFTICF